MTKPDIEIRMATIDDLRSLVAHNLRHMREKGVGGGFAHPFPSNHPWDPEDMFNDCLSALSKDITDYGWSRFFLVLKDQKIKGSLTFRGGRGPSASHRIQLGMGLEEELRGQGIGPKLLNIAIEWAKAQPTLFWIDLGVFSTNAPAIKLYKKMGFTEQCTVFDRFRIAEGNQVVSIDDIAMTLKLK